MKLYNNDNIPMNFYDIAYNKNEEIHKKLFEDAINKYFEEENINKEDFKIIDQINKMNILKPSIAILLEKGISKKLKYIDLTPYWNSNYKESLNKKEDNSIFENLLINEENKKHIEIEYIDYVNGKIEFKNKMTNKKFFINFDKLDKTKDYHQKIKNTFTSLYYE